MSQQVFDRLLLPVAEEADAEVTCDAIRPYLGSDCELIVVHVVERDDPPSEDEQERADTIFEIVQNQLADDISDVRTVLRHSLDPISEIIASADTLEATAIGFTPRPENRWVKLLSEDRTHQLTAESTLPVLIFPHPDQVVNLSKAVDDDEFIRRVLVPIDGSALSLEAIRHACSVYSGAEVTALHIEQFEGPNVYDSMSSGPSDEAAEADREQDYETNELFEEAQAVADEYDVTLSTRVLTGNVAGMIQTATEETDIDLIVMARHGRTGIKERVLGSTTESVVRNASVPVTVIQ